MTIFARPLSFSTLFRRAAAAGAILTMAVLCGCLLTAVPAGAVVVHPPEGAATVGLQPTDLESLVDGRIKNGGENLEANSFGNSAGNPVLHESNVYVIYWDPTYHYHDDWKSLIDNFLERVGHSAGALNNSLAVDAQYTDRSDHPATEAVNFHGATEDYEPYPPSKCTDPRPLEVSLVFETGPLGCLTDAQMREQLKYFVESRKLPKGMNTVYYLLTPPGLTVCLDKGGLTGHCSDFHGGAESSNESYANSFCSYHADINPGGLETGDGNTLLYSVIPWTAGGLGDHQLGASDQNKALYCQGGVFNPTSKPIEEAEGVPVQQEPNLKSCPTEDGFCDAGLADLIINQIGVEQQNTTTDPLLNAWKDSEGNESTDECRNFFAPAFGTYAANPETGVGNLYNQTFGAGTYYINDAFNLAGLRLNDPGIFCLTGINLVPKFTAPDPVKTGEMVSFDGLESNITLNSAVKYSPNGATENNYATYKWNFGDGSSEVIGYAPGTPPCNSPWLAPCASSVFHTYTYGGEYQVTLTVSDVGAHVASTTRTIDVLGTPPPSPTPTPSGPSQGTGSSSSSSSSSSSTATSSSGSSQSGASGGPVAPVPLPFARTAILSRSLKSTLGKTGLAVRYTVNEQVAGRFEVLLSRTIAHQLGIAGPAATGMAAGSPAQVVIAKAFLVTTKGGTSVVHIQFSKQTAARLHRLRKVSLLLRLVVRNAGSKSPASATTLTAVTLAG